MKKEKTLTLMDMIGMTLSAFVSMELISSMAGIGPSVIAAFITQTSHTAWCVEP